MYHVSQMTDRDLLGHLAELLDEASELLEIVDDQRALDFDPPTLRPAIEEAHERRYREISS